MNPLLESLAGLFLRYLILMLAGAMGIGPAVHVFLDAHTSETDQTAGAIVLAIGTAGYAAYRQFVKRKVLLTALASPVPMSEEQAKADVRDPAIATPSVKTPKDVIPKAGPRP